MISSLPMTALSFVLAVASDPDDPLSATRLPDVSLHVPNVRARVLFDSDGMGRIFASAATYKMQFEDGAAAFVPRFGIRAERNLPLRLSIGDRARPERHGNRVSLDHGGFVEVYDLAIDEVEQSFVFPRRPAAGDLVVVQKATTDLALHSCADGGLRFSAGGLGDVRYEHAVAVDATGRRFAVVVTAAAETIELRVPRASVAEATFPLTIDPTISTLAIDTGSNDAANPDVAYSPTDNTFLVVFEDAVSANDRDILQRRFDLNGNLKEELPVDISSDDSTTPAVAERSGTFLIVWRAVPSLILNDEIRARKRIASTGVLGNTFDVSSTLFGSVADPDVGSADDSVAEPFLVTWSQSGVGTGMNIRAQAVADNGAFGGFFTIAALFDETRPRVNQRCRPGGVWVVAFESDSGTSVFGAANDIGYRQISPSGVVGSTQVLTSSSAQIDRAPEIAGDGFHFLVAWATDDATNDDVMIRALENQNGAVAPSTPVTSLALLDHVGLDTNDQTDPAVGFDGCRFLVAYRERQTSSNFDVFATSLTTATGLVAIEKHGPVAPSAFDDREPSIASCGLDQPGRHLITWTRTPTGDHDVVGAFFTTLGTGGVTTVQTGCGAPEPTLVTSNAVVLGGDFGILIGNVVNPLLLLGSPTSVPLCPGQGGCVLGVSPLVITPTPTFLTATVPCDPALLGASFATQVIDLLPPSATGSMCGPPKYTQKFRVSDTRVSTIQ